MTFNNFSHIFVGKANVIEHEGVFVIENFDKEVPHENFHIQLYSIHGVGPVILKEKKGNQFFFTSGDKEGKMGYQITVEKGEKKDAHVVEG